MSKGFTAANLYQKRHRNVFRKIAMTPSRDLDKVWLVFCTDKAMSDEKVDDDQTTVWLEGGRVVVED
jgi:hypothetical protein